MPYLKEQLALPAISCEDNKNLTDLIEQFFWKVSNESTQQIGNRLSKEIANYLYQNDVAISEKFYAPSFDIESYLMCVADGYIRNIISFAIRNAVQLIYISPFVRFFAQHQTQSAGKVYENQLFAMIKLQQSLQVFDNDTDKIYGFIQESFLRTSPSQDKLPLLDKVCFSQYRYQSNRLPRNKDMNLFINLFNKITARMQREVTTEFDSLLAVDGLNYDAFIHDLAGKLYFDELTKSACKKALFDYLFSNPNVLLKETSAGAKYHEQLTTNINFYLASIEEQLQQWTSSKQPPAIQQMVAVFKSNKKNLATSIEKFGALVAIAAEASPERNFFNHHQRSRINYDFLDIIKRFYKVCDELNILPQAGQTTIEFIKKAL